MMADPVVKTIVVPCSPATAFAIFTRDMTQWWPMATNTVSAMSGTAARSLTLEPKVGGALVEVAGDGTQHHWGNVTDWRPGSRLALSWHAGGSAAAATQVEVAFIDSEAGTKVTLTHSGWQVLGEQADGARDGYNSGWVKVFEEGFAGACRSG